MKEIILLGCGPTHVECPYDKETWSVGSAYKFAKRLDRLFFFDDIKHCCTENPQHFDMEELKLLNKHVPYMASKKYDEFQNLTLYPLEEVVKKFQSRFFANSVCYMIALALHEEYEAIWLYGIDHISYPEYVLAKGCVEYWMGRAEERIGVKNLHIPEGSALCKTQDGKLYGYDGVDIKDAETISIFY